MRILISIIAIAAALWSGYWYLGATAKKSVLESWFEDRRAAGWTAEYETFDVVGFPNRFDSRFHGLDLDDPQSGLGWQAPLFDILAPSYQPNHIIAAFAADQTVTTRFEDIRVQSRDMMASVVFEPDTGLAVNRLQLSAADLHLGSSLGWNILADKVLLATRQNPTVPFAHDVVLDIARLTPTKAFRGGLDPAGRLPAEIDTLYVSLSLGFAAPWDRLAIETGAPEVTRIEVHPSRIVWGKLELGVSGALAVAPDGMIEGRLDLAARNWRDILGLFVTGGVIGQNMADTIATGIAFLGGDDGNGIEVPLLLNDGAMSLGPVPLGPAPRFIRG